MRFHDRSEEIKGNHVKDEVHIICVDEAAGDKPVILAMLSYSRWPEYQFVDDSVLSEACDRNKTCNENDGKSNGNIEHGG
jgi:hypothetical protein